MKRGLPQFLVRTLVAGLAMTMMAALPARAQTVLVGELGIVADAPFYIGIEKGYFKERKLEVALQRFDSAAQATAPLSTGQIQVAGGAVSAGLFNAFARDWPVRIAMARTRDMAGYSSDMLLVRPDLKDQIKTVADLKGRKIALPAPNIGLHYMIATLLESGGLTLKDVDLVFMPWPNMGPAFDTKAIDLGAVTEPFAALYGARNTALVYQRASDVLANPPLEASVILYSKDWIDQKPDQVRDFTIAYLMGARDYIDAMRGGPKRAEVVDILMRNTSLKQKELYDRIQWSYMDPNGELSLKGLGDQQDWYAKNGAVPKKVEVDKMIDRRALDAALGALGKL